MASVLKVDEMQGVTSAGDITITSEGGAATMSLQQGLAKAWGHFDPSADNTIDDSLNLASLTDDGAGDYRFNFSSNMANADFAASGSAQRTSIWGIDTSGGRQGYNTGALEFYVTNSSASAWDVLDVTATIHGDLA